VCVLLNFLLQKKRKIVADITLIESCTTIANIQHTQVEKFSLVIITFCNLFSLFFFLRSKDARFQTPRCLLVIDDLSFHCFYMETLVAAILPPSPPDVTHLHKKSHNKKWVSNLPWKMIKLETKCVSVFFVFDQCWKVLALRIVASLA
jgi:hypothetical protein